MKLKENMMPSSGANFFHDVDELKNQVRNMVRDDIQASINRAHYSQGITMDLATTLACEAVAEIYANLPGREPKAASQILHWLADQIGMEEPEDENGEDGLIYE
jgi:hypothetical protein